MTVYCPTAPTLISVDAGDYVQYPVGTDVEVLPVSLIYPLACFYNNYNPSTGAWNAGFFRWIVWGWNGSGVVDLYNSNGTNVGSSFALSQVSDQQLYDSCIQLTSGSGFNFVQTNSFSPNGIPTGLFRLYYNGVDAIGYEAGGNSRSTSSRSVSAYRLKITTP